MNKSPLVRRVIDRELDQRGRVLTRLLVAARLAPCSTTALEAVRGRPVIDRAGCWYESYPPGAFLLPRDAAGSRSATTSRTGSSAE